MERHAILNQNYPNLTLSAQETILSWYWVTEDDLDQVIEDVLREYIRESTELETLDEVLDYLQTLNIVQTLNDVLTDF